MNVSKIIEWTIGAFDEKRLALATSFGAEDQVLTHLLAEINPRARIFNLDTGRLFEATYDVMQRTQERYGFRFEVLTPDSNALGEMVANHGPNLFYESVEKRKLCCQVRKVRQLEAVLKSVDAWITGLRAEQSVTRTGLEVIEWDAAHEIFKINPLAAWSEKQVWEFIRAHSVPYNRLHDQGFRSIGCAPCTRAVKDGEDIRSGRWWWESPEHKECGLHARHERLKGSHGTS